MSMNRDGFVHTDALRSLLSRSEWHYGGGALHIAPDDALRAALLTQLEAANNAADGEDGISADSASAAIRRALEAAPGGASWVSA